MWFKQKDMPTIDKWLSIFLITASMIVFFIICYKSLFFPLSYDEGYELQVVDLLAKGQGYASYGMLKGNGPWVFDPHITTGPVILLPLALIWKLSHGSVIAMRLSMLTFLFLYLWGIIFLFKNSHWNALVGIMAASMSLCFINLRIEGLIGESQVVAAGKILGELPASTAIIWVALLASRNKWLWAALLAGLAVQIKLVFGLAGTIVLLSCLTFKALTHGSIKLKTFIFSSILFIAPSFLFEIWRFLSFGNLPLYFKSIGELKTFLSRQNINSAGTWSNSKYLDAKFSGLLQAVPSMGWWACGIALLIILFKSASSIFSNKKTILDHTNFSPLIACVSLLIAGCAMLVGWITQSSQLAARQALPFLLLSLPTLLALGAIYFFELRKKNNSGRYTNLFSSIILVLWVGVLLCGLYSNAKSIMKDNTIIASFENQRKIVTILKKSAPKSLFVDEWWQNPEYLLLTAIPGVPFKTGDSQILIIQDYQMQYLVKKNQQDLYKQLCARKIYASPFALVCWMPEKSSS